MEKFSSLSIRPKLFLYLVLSFMFMTVVGTLTHELGHYSAARLLGYPASINYKSARTDYSAVYDEITAIRKNTPNVIQRDKSDPQRMRFFALNKKVMDAEFFISMAGPLQTLLTGSIGFFCLFLFRKRLFVAEQVSVKAWTLIFMALFWLRQPANATMFIAQKLVYPNTSAKSDELHLALLLDWPSGSILFPSAIIGSAVLLYVIYLLPKTIRLTFLLAGAVGGVLGFAGWMFWLGKILMP